MDTGVCPNSSRNFLEGAFLRLRSSPRSITTSCSYVLPLIRSIPKENSWKCIFASWCPPYRDTFLKLSFVPASRMNALSSTLVSHELGLLSNTRPWRKRFQPIPDHRSEFSPIRRTQSPINILRADRAALCSVWCAEHVRQLGGASPLHNVMDVK